MNEARLIFEAMMRGHGHTDLTRKADKYNMPSVQTRWRYFLLGWEMCCATKGNK